MGRVMQLAAFSLAEVTYAGGDIGYQIQESVTEATLRVGTKQENVSGVIIPTFESARTTSEAGPSGSLLSLDLVHSLTANNDRNGAYGVG